MSGTVWVVERGSYSDYHVVGVFSSRENADRIADALNQPDEDGIKPSDEATVVEWPLDPAIGEMNAGLSQWLVWMLRDGTTEKCEPIELSSCDLVGRVAIWQRSKAPYYQRRGGAPDCLDATVWAKDAEHAVKIANEHRTRLIASGEW